MTRKMGGVDRILLLILLNDLVRDEVLYMLNDLVRDDVLVCYTSTGRSFRCAARGRFLF